MARKFYGLGAADVAAQISSDGDYEPPTSRTFDAYEVRTGGSAVTALLNYSGGAITAVTAAADGTIRFQGRDTYTGSYWLQDQAFPANPRVGPFVPHDTLDRLVALEAGSAGIAATIVDVKGDIIAATAADAVARLAAGANNTILTADSTQTTGLRWGGAPIPASIVDVKGDLVAASANDVVARLPVGTDNQILTADSTQTLGVKWASAAAAPALAGLTDTSVASPADLDLLQYRNDTGLWTKTPPSGLFAAIDATGRLAAADWPLGFLPTAVINQGGTVPSYVPAGGIVGVRSTVVQALAVTTIGGNGVSSNTVTTFTNSVGFVSGDYAVVCVSISGEGTVPAVTVTGPTNIGAMTAGPVTSNPFSTVLNLMFYVKATGTVATGQTFTVTAGNSRSDIAATGMKLQGVVATSPVDQTGIANGNNTAPTVVASGPTSTASEIAVGCFGWNDTAGGVFAAAGGATQVGITEHSTDASPRAVAAAYRILTAAGTPTIAGTLGTAGVVWTGAIMTFKGA